jgi:hypothetical protein
MHAHDQPGARQRPTPPGQAVHRADADRLSPAHPADPGRLLELQRLAGNAAVGRLVASWTGGSVQRDQSQDPAVDATRASVDAVVRSAGEPLAPAVRVDMEAVTGRDQSAVRIHRDAAAHHAAKSLGAYAFTTGTHIAFQQGRYNPTSDAGRRMLRHELEHVDQQSRGSVEGTDMGNGMSVSHPSDRHEKAAVKAGDSMPAQRVVDGTVDETAPATEQARSAQRIAVQREGAAFSREMKSGEVQRMVGTPSAGPQVQRANGHGQTLNSPLLSGDQLLVRIINGQNQVAHAQHATGQHVAILQQALNTVTRRRLTVDGVFGPRTIDTVNEFQGRQGMFGTGVVDQTTLARLDQALLAHTPAQQPAPAGAYGHGVPGGMAVVGQQGAGGALSTFNRSIDPNLPLYDQRISQALLDQIDEDYNDLVRDRPPRTDAYLMQESDINRVAAIAKEVTDAVFGQYGVGDPLKYGENVRDLFEVRGAQMEEVPGGRTRAANEEIRRILESDAVRQIDHEHGAVQNNAAESQLLRPVIEEVTIQRFEKLVAIHQHWPGVEEEGRINIQRFWDRNRNPQADRAKLYNLFGTMIHEYLHGLEHDRYQDFYESGGRQEKVLSEGMTDYWAKMVWDQLTFDPDFRRRIEGPLYDPAAKARPSEPARYSEMADAEQIVNTIGRESAAAAYFHGRTNLIPIP